MTEPKVSLTNASVDQEQFLTILSREEAIARFEAALFPRDMSANDRALTDALGLALASDVFAVVDVPPFDRSNVDGFAVRSADLVTAGEASPVHLRLRWSARSRPVRSSPKIARRRLENTDAPDRYLTRSDN